MKFQAECLGGLKVDHELEFGRSYHRQIARLLPLENSSGVVTDMAIGIGNAGPVAHQGAGYHCFPLCVNRQNCVARRKRDDTLPMGI